jgi:general secretion pathway protein K
MCCRRSDIRSRQHGAALVVALLVFALAAALLVGLQRDFTLQLQRSANHTMSEQVWAYFLGAEALAAVALRADVEADARTEPAIDDLNEMWAQPPAPYGLDEGGWLSGQLQDLQGRLNLNSLAGGGAEGSPRFTVEQKMMIRLLQSFEDVPVTLPEAMALTEAISDFIDPDDTRRLEGAEDNSYRGGDFPYRAANRPLSSVSELRAVKGMTDPLYRALAPHVSVWPVEGAEINWRTATLPVLRAMNADDDLEPMPQLEAERLAEQRAQGALTDTDALLTDPFFAGRDTAQLAGMLTERTNWFLLISEVEIADRMRRLYSVLERNGRSITVLYRTDGEL